jgi:type 1 fimbria pilin
MRGMMRQLKSSNQMMKNGNKVSASDFGGVANYDFHQFYKKNPKDQTHDEQICDSVSEDTMRITISYCSAANETNDNILHNTAARDDVSAHMIMNDDNRCDSHKTSASNPLQKTETNIEIENHEQSLSRLDKVRSIIFLKKYLRTKIIF